MKNCLERVANIIPDDRQITLLGKKVSVESLDLLESRTLILKLFRETEALYDINSQVNSGFRGKLLRFCGILLPISKPTYHLLDFDIRQNALQMVNHIEKTVFLWRQSQNGKDYLPVIHNAIHDIQRSKIEEQDKYPIIRRLKICISLLENKKTPSVIKPIMESTHE